MKFIDLHCDCINRLYYCENKQNILKNSYHVDIEKLKKGECFVQTFAIFLDEEHIKRENLNLFDEFKNMLQTFYYQIDIAKDHIIYIADKKSDCSSMMALLSCEGCDFIQNNISRIDYLYKSGIKMASLTWNYENTLAYPSSSNIDIMQSGLKKLGFEAVEFLNEKKIIADISHLSDKGAADLLFASKLPVIASHSNARALANNPRNLSDELIKKIADKGGIIGINFYPPFLTGAKEACIEDIIKHIDYIINIGGEDSISLGSDFDGIEYTPQIDDVSKMQNLFEALIKNGCSYETAEKIFYKNALRVLKEFDIL